MMWGQHSTMVLLLDPAASGLILILKKISEEKNVYVAENNQWRCLQESGQLLKNVSQNHLVLASGKVQKIITQFHNLPEMLLATLSNRVFSRK